MLYYAAKYHVETGTPIKECLTAVRHGFKPEYYAFLGLGSRDPEVYVSRESREYIERNYRGPFRHANQNARHVLQDKVAIYSIFDTIDGYFPELYGTIHDGRYSSHDDGVSNSLLEAVETYGTVAAKPVDKEQGKGFYKISVEDGFLINGEKITEEGLEQVQGDLAYSNYMVTEYVQQHDYADRIFPRTTNTIRVLTVIDPDTGKPHIVRPVHRFGTTESVPVDNFDNGGVIAPINIESGKLGSLVVLDENGKRQRRNDHPDTEVSVAGINVPMWDNARNVILEGAQSYPTARIIGWDLVITSHQPIILEASGQPSNVIPQLERGLLENSTVRRVLERADKRV